MEVSELRIGNVVSTFRAIGNYWSWTFISHEDIYSISCGNGNNFKPIPLTEEWLLKFGFERNGKKLTFWKIDLVEDEEGIFSFDESRIYIDIKYVHQLQNLYFALTGEELKKQEQ